jgi:DNA polymerase-3 subunit epsilon
MLDQLREIVKRNNFVVLDTETTGLERPAEIIEISIVGCGGYVLLDTLVRPVRPVPEFIAGLTGINNSMVAGAPTWPPIRERVLEIIKGKDVLVYNAKYDRQLMHWTDEAHQTPHVDYKANANWFCVMECYAEIWGQIHAYYGTYVWQKLTNAVTQQQLKIENAHRAMGDCNMTLALVQKLCEPETELFSWDEFIQSQ